MLTSAEDTGLALNFSTQKRRTGLPTLANLRIGLQRRPRQQHKSTLRDVKSRIPVSISIVARATSAIHIVHPAFLRPRVAQFDSSRKRVLGDFLASYELSPGTVVHAGYGSLFGRALDDVELDRYTATARALFFKASYLLRF